MKRSHYCKVCNKFSACTESDPELFAAFGACGHQLTLTPGSLEENKKELALARDEVDERPVTYKPL